MQSFGSRDFRQTLGRFATGITVVSMRGSDLDEAATPTVAAGALVDVSANAAAGVVSPEAAAAALAGPAPSRPRTYGITVNAFMSVSLEPPLVAVSIGRNARAHATLLSAERFGISVLAAEQDHVSDLFAGRPVRQRAEPFEEFAGFPVVEGAIAQLVCRSHQAHDAGDHTIFVGEVEALRTREGEPLVFYRGAYRALPDLALAR